MENVMTQLDLQKVLSKEPPEMQVWIALEGRTYKLSLPPFPIGEVCTVRWLLNPVEGVRDADKPVWFVVEPHADLALLHGRQRDAGKKAMPVEVTGTASTANRLTLLCRPMPEPQLRVHAQDNRQGSHARGGVARRRRHDPFSVGRVP